MFLLFTYACQEAPEPAIQQVSGASFFPLQVGDYWIYAVHQTDYENTGNSVESDFYLKDEITDSIVSGGVVQYQGYRYSSEDTTRWKIEQTISYSRTAHYASKTIGNKTTVVLSFPVSPNKRWDGEALNDAAADTFQLKDLYEPFQQQSDSFPLTIRVEQENNEDSLIFLDNRQEVYAQNKGLVYKLFSQLQFCNKTDCFGQGIIEYGKTYEYQLIKFGRNP